jgi:hypothetical protein
MTYELLATLSGLHSVSANPTSFQAWNLSQEAVGSLFDHMRLARQRFVTGRRPGMGGSGAACDAESPQQCRSSSSLASSASASPGPVASLLGCGADGLHEDSFRDEDAVNETLAQVGGVWRGVVGGGAVRIPSVILGGQFHVSPPCAQAGWIVSFPP